MIETVLLWIITSFPVLVGTSALAALGIGGWALNLFKGWAAIAARFGGIAALCATTFIFGFRVADDRAAHQAQVASLKADNARLTRDLGQQKIIAQKAEELRDGVLKELQDRNAKVTDYEAKLAEKPQAPSCNLTAADIRALRGLRAKP
jgi:hypothetical protein